MDPVCSAYHEIGRADPHTIVPKSAVPRIGGFFGPEVAIIRLQ
jgi:hypothetical protein